MQDQLLDAPTALDQLVSELNHSGKAQYTGMVFQVPVRLNIELYGMVEALTHHAGTSRNKLMNQLIDVGIKAALQALPDAVVDKLYASAHQAMQTVDAMNAGLLERGEV